MHLLQVIFSYFLNLQNSVIFSRFYRPCTGHLTEGKFARSLDPLGFVIAMNLHRRHLNESQRGMVAARMANMKHGEVGRNHEKSEGQICTSEAAEKLNVSPRSVKSAKAVQRTGTPDLIEAVDSGKVAVSTAATVATLPEPEQIEIVAKGEKEILQAAKKIRATRSEVKRAEKT